MRPAWRSRAGTDALSSARTMKASAAPASRINDGGFDGGLPTPAACVSDALAKAIGTNAPTMVQLPRLASSCRVPARIGRHETPVAELRAVVSSVADLIEHGGVAGGLRSPPGIRGCPRNRAHWQHESLAVIVSRRLAARVLYRVVVDRGESHGHRRLEVTRARAGWRFVHFAVRQIAAGQPWTSRTPASRNAAWCCSPATAASPLTAAPRRSDLDASVFAAYPHAIYLPPGTAFRVDADEPTRNWPTGARPRARRAEQGQAARARGPRESVIRPESCGFEIRGGGNATRQIVDIIRPGFPGRSTAGLRGLYAGRQLVQLSAAQARRRSARPAK